MGIQGLYTIVTFGYNNICNRFSVSQNLLTPKIVNFVCDYMIPQSVVGAFTNLYVSICPNHRLWYTNLYEDLLSHISL